MRRIEAMFVAVMAAALIAWPGAGQGSPGIVLHGISESQGCAGARAHAGNCVELAPQETVPPGSSECVDVYLAAARDAQAAQFSLHLGDGWQYLSWSDGDVRSEATLLARQGRDLMVCVTLDSTATDRMTWLGTVQCVSGASGSGLELNDATLPSGAGILTSDNTILAMGEDTSDPLLVGGENVAGCGSGPMRAGPHPGTGDGEETRVTRRLIPNPLRTGVLIEWSAEAKPVTMDVYDVKGRLLRTIRDDGKLGGLRARWDGRTDEGRRLSTGVYLLRIHQGSLAWSRKVLYLR